MGTSWERLHAELLAIFNGSAHNLNAVADLMKYAVESYANQDDAAKQQLLIDYEGDIPWELWSGVRCCGGCGNAGCR